MGACKGFDWGRMARRALAKEYLAWAELTPIQRRKLLRQADRGLERRGSVPWCLDLFEALKAAGYDWAAAVLIAALGERCRQELARRNRGRPGWFKFGIASGT